MSHEWIAQEDARLNALIAAWTPAALSGDHDAANILLRAHAALSRVRQERKTMELRELPEALEDPPRCEPYSLYGCHPGGRRTVSTVIDLMHAKMPVEQIRHRVGLCSHVFIGELVRDYVWPAIANPVYEGPEWSIP